MNSKPSLALIFIGSLLLFGFLTFFSSSLSHKPQTSDATNSELKQSLLPVEESKNGHEGDVAMNSPPKAMTYSNQWETSSYAEKFPSSFYHLTSDHLKLSSIGIGTYIGDMGKKTDDAVVVAIVRSVKQGVNVIDSAINYRQQKGERCVGRAVTKLQKEGVGRGSLFIATKVIFNQSFYHSSSCYRLDSSLEMEIVM